MPGRREIDPRFLSGPFLSREFLAHGYSEKVLRGMRFRRLYPRVWVAAAHVLTPRDRIEAARLCMPSAARMTGITRIQSLGLSADDLEPMHFVVASDLHIAVPDIVLHRTVSMPPTDEIGVTPAAAFIAYCTEATLIDAVAVGDWLIFHEHMTIEELSDLVTSQPWRDGAREARYVLLRLVRCSRSLPESKLRMMLMAAGIEGLEVNAVIAGPDGRPIELDLLVRSCRISIEYEGSHHQQERRQYLKDIERYGRLRELGYSYTQVTKEHMREPRAMTAKVYGDLAAAGYSGPRPLFGRRWYTLFRPVRETLRQARHPIGTRAVA